MPVEPRATPEPTPAPPGSGAVGRRAMGNSIALGTTLAVTWMLSFVGQVALRRTLGTSDVGTVAFYESLTALAVTMIAFGVETHIRREVAINPSRALEFALPLVRLRLLLGTALVAGFVIAATLSHSETEVVVLAGITAASQVVVMLGTTGAAYLHAVQRVRGVTVSSLVTKMVWLLVLLAVLTDARTALVAAPVALLSGEVVRVIWLGRLFRREIGRPRPGTLGQAVSVMRASLPYHLDGLNQAFTASAIPALLGWFAARPEVGLYATASQLMSIPFFFLPVMLWVLPPVFSRLHADDPERMQAAARRLTLCAIPALIPVAAVVVIGAEPVTRLLYGDDFGPAGPAIEVLALTVPTTFVSVMLSSALIAQGRAWGVTRLNAVTLVGMVISAVVAVSAAPAGSVGSAAAWGAGTLAVWEMVTTVWFWVLIGIGRPDRSFVIRVGLAMAALLTLVGLRMADAASLVPTVITLGVIAATTPVAARNVVRTLRSLIAA